LTYLLSVPLGTSRPPARMQIGLMGESVDGLMPVGFLSDDDLARLIQLNLLTSSLYVRHSVHIISAGVT
jgi:hypothetical protein